MNSIGTGTTKRNSQKPFFFSSLNDHLNCNSRSVNRLTVFNCFICVELLIELCCEYTNEMDEFHYFTDDFLSNGGFQQLYTTVEYPEEICLWESRSIDSQPYHQDNVENIDSNNTNSHRIMPSSVECPNSLIDSNASIYNSVNNILTQYSEASKNNQTQNQIPMPNESFITDMDQWKLNHSDRFCEGSTGASSSTTEWELNLDNLIFDVDHPGDVSSMPIELPEKTFFCNDSCNLFLKESSEHLNTNLLSFRPSPSSSSPITSQPSTDTEIKDANGVDEKSFICTYGECRKVYAKAGHLKAHLRRHIGDKPYVCVWPNCTWKFSRSDELSRHRRSHSGIKPYKCDYCPKCFSRSDHLTKHRKVHERKMAALKVNAVWTSLPQGRPGRRPKILASQQDNVQ